MHNPFMTKRRIEFSDTDMAGIVHFARFFIFMETAEHEFLRSLGLGVSMEVHGDPVGWPRVAASCDYLRPVYFEDELAIHLTVIHKGAKSLTYRAVFLKDGDVVARGKLTASCCICRVGEPLQSIAIPDEIGALIKEYPEEMQS